MTRLRDDPLAACTLALSPICDRLIEGFSHLVTSITAPILGHLKEMGIPVVMGLAGVGQGLMDHPSIALSSYIRRGARMNKHTRRHIQMGLRYSSGMQGTPDGDMFVAVLSSRPGMRSANRSPRCSPSTRPTPRPGR
jgi:hypothetical protein